MSTLTLLSPTPLATAIPSGYKQTEIGILPEDWEALPLIEISEPDGLVRGPFGGSLKKEIFVKAGYTVYEQRHAIRGDAEVSRYFINKDKYDELRRFQVSSGDIIISCSGTIGKIFKLPNSAPAGIINQALLKITLKNNINSNYFISLFRSNYIQAKIVDSSHGGAMPNLVGMEDFKKTLFQFPKNEEEQKLIAEALSDVDALIASLERLIVKKRDIKTATMQQLLTGKKRLPGFGEGKGYKQTELGEIPEDWEVKPLGEFTDKVGSGITPTGGSNVYKVAGRPFIRSQNIGWGDFRLEDLAYIDEEIHSTFSASEIKEHDVLLNITGASIGRSSIATLGLAGGNVNQHVCIIRLKEKEFNSKYVNQLLLSILGQKQVESFQAGGNRQGLNFGQIKSFLLPKPQLLEEQKCVAQVLSDMDEELGLLEARLEKTRAVKQGMMQELLTGRTRLI